jgi:hypothetical protein
MSSITKWLGSVNAHLRHVSGTALLGPDRRPSATIIEMIQPIWMRPRGLSLPAVLQAFAARLAGKRNVRGNVRLASPHRNFVYSIAST